MKDLFFILIALLSVQIKAQSLEDFLEIAKQNNATIKVKTSEYVLAQEKVHQVGTYQNTNISLGVFALQPETRVGAQIFKLGAKQKLPWFGEFDAQKEAVKQKAAIKQYDIILTEKDLNFQVKKAYYTIYKEQAITKILKNNEQILKAYERMALAALSNNRATMSDVLRIRVQKNELHSKILQNTNSIEALSSNFNRLLQRDKNTVVTIIDSLNVLDVLVPKGSVEKHPSIEKITKMDAVYTAEEKLIGLDKKPKIAIGLDYIMVDRRKDIAVSQNGKDILMPNISLAIPIFNKKYQSQYKQIAIQQDMLKDAVLEQKNNLEIALDTAILAFDNAVLAVVTAQKNKAEMQLAINLDLKAYETGILDYDKILRLQIQKLKYQYLEIEASKNAFIAKSKIAYLVENK